jgi:hypothetical protein
MSHSHPIPSVCTVRFVILLIMWPGVLVPCGGIPAGVYVLRTRLGQPMGLSICRRSSFLAKGRVCVCKVTLDHQVEHGCQYPLVGYTRQAHKTTVLARAPMAPVGIYIYMYIYTYYMCVYIYMCTPQSPSQRDLPPTLGVVGGAVLHKVFGINTKE